MRKINPVFVQQLGQVSETNSWTWSQGAHRWTFCDISPINSIQFNVSVTHQGSLPFPINRNWLEVRQIHARLYWGLCYSRGEEEQTGSLACLLTPWGWGGVGGVCSLHGVRVRVCPQVESEGWLRWFAHPQVVVCAGCMQSTLLLLLALQKWQLVF